MLNRKPSISIRVLDGFNDPSLDEAVWQRLLSRGESNTVFLTPWWQKAWWESFGRGRLLLLGVFRGGELVGFAPLFADGGMIFYTGSGGSDYLDFVGEIPDHAKILEQAIKAVPGFIGFRFYHVPDTSGTGLALQQAAQRLGLVCYDEGDLPAPAIDLTMTGTGIVRKKSLVRHQRFFEREGVLSVHHFDTATDIIPNLEPFFEQHIARWSVTPHPSLFLDPIQREFYNTLAKSAGENSWLRFTEIIWNDTPIAFHFGFNYDGTYMWYKPSFAIEFAKHSPGEVLIRSLLLEALDKGIKVFDLGLGGESFKDRFATHTLIVRTWGLYPPDSTDDHIRSKSGMTG